MTANYKWNHTTDDLGRDLYVLDGGNITFGFIRKEGASMYATHWINGLVSSRTKARKPEYFSTLSSAKEYLTHKARMSMKGTHFRV